MTIKKPAKKIVVNGAAGMVAKIKSEVQAFASGLVEVTCNTLSLAPKVAEAYAAFVAKDDANTKLDFCKLFASKEQLVGWPESDKAAKAPESKVQALFNGIEYLLRKAPSIAKTEKRNIERQVAVDNAVKEARVLAKTQNLKGEELEQFIANAKANALSSFSPSAGRGRHSVDKIAETIQDAWYSEMDDYDVFSAFCTKMLKLKYSDKTAISIVAAATAKIAAIQAEVEAKAATAAAGAEPARPRVLGFGLSA